MEARTDLEEGDELVEVESMGLWSSIGRKTASAYEGGSMKEDEDEKEEEGKRSGSRLTVLW